MKMTGPAALALFALALPTTARAQGPQVVRLGDLDLTLAEQARRKPLANRSRDGKPLTMGGRVYDSGVGTEAYGLMVLDLGATAQRFTAEVGVDDESKGTPASLEFQILADDKLLWSSGVLRPGPARKVDLALAGVRTLFLVVNDGGDGPRNDHADWADARITYTGAKPKLISRPRQAPVVLTPKPGPQPRINSARIFGVRPGSPVLYTIAASGERPMTFEARGLPRGLVLDRRTGQLTGTLQQRGEHALTLVARNRRGHVTSPLRLVVGDKLALTPPMGWNSWNCFGGAVTADKVKAAADAMVSSGLRDHGWTNINIDDFWEVHRDSKDPTLQGPQRDAGGKVLANPRFPDMAGLASYIHRLGLRAGLYSSPGPWTCGGCVGSYQHEEADAARYAEWGFDYLKYDWCSYKTIAKDKSLETLKAPYLVMRDALARQKRDIVFSLCQYGVGDVWEWGESVGGHLWRTTGDITDTWPSMASIGFGQAGHETFAGPGHWNDPDMLVVGHVGWGKNLHPTRLSPDEQYTHLSLWVLLSAPLLIGADMTQLDDFTLNLLTNDEVLEIDQDPLGRQAARVWKEGELEAWAKDLEDGSRAVGLFNRGYLPARIAVKASVLGLTGPRVARDLWRQTDVGTVTDELAAEVPAHGVVLYRLRGQANETSQGRPRPKRLPARP
jgi:alpha-galactosidase